MIKFIYQVICQVEAVITDDWALPGGRPSTRVLATTTSPPFIAGIVIDPMTDIITAYKNGSHVNVTLSTTMPFICAPHLSAKDCHLSVQIVQHMDEDNVDNEISNNKKQPLAIAPCSLSLGSGSQSFLVVPVSDFVKVRNNVTHQLQLMVTSYGDAWWHGFQLPNITIQVSFLYLFEIS